MKQLLLTTVVLIFALTGTPSSLLAVPAPITVCSSSCDHTLAQLTNALNAANAAGVSSGLPQIVQITAGQTATAVCMPLQTATTPLVTIQSSQADTFVDGVTVNPVTDVSRMATIDGMMAPCNRDYTGTTRINGYKLKAIRQTTSVSGTGNTLFSLEYILNGSFTGQPKWWPRRFEISHCFFDVPNSIKLRNGILVSGDDVYIHDSYIMGGHGTSADNTETHTLAGINVGKRFRLENNVIYGLGTAINFLFGGGMSGQNGIRADLPIIRNNKFWRPFKGRIRSGTADPTGTCRWDADDTYGEWFKRTDNNTGLRCHSGAWESVAVATLDTFVANMGYNKNNFEFKQVVNAIVEGNIFIGGWADPNNGSQYGSCGLLNLVDNDAGAGVFAYWASIRGVLFRNNILRECGKGMSQAAVGGPYPFRTQVEMWNNHWEDIASADVMGIYDGNANSIQLSGAIGAQAESPNYRAVYRNNTVLAARPFLSGDTAGLNGIAVVDNVTDAEGGVYKSTVGGGIIWTALSSSWDEAGRVFARNAVYSTVTTCVNYGAKCPSVNLLFARDFAGGANTSGPQDGLANAPFNFNSTMANTRTGAAWPVKADILDGSNNPTANYKVFGLNGGPVGANQKMVAAATGGIATGVMSSYHNFQPPGISISAGTVTFRYVAPKEAYASQCTVRLTSTALSTEGGTTATDTANTLSRTVTMNPSAGRYWWSVDCGGNNLRIAPAPIVIP